MDRRRLMQLVLVLGALILIGRWLSARQQTAPTGQPPVQVVPSTLNAGALTAIEWSVGPLADPPKVRLVNDPQRGWVVATLRDLPADPERIDRVVSQLRGLTGDVRATGAQWAPEFRVGDDEGLRVVLRQGDTVVSDLIINRNQRASWISFVRPRDRDVIIAVEKNLMGELADVWGDLKTYPPESKPWVDLRLFPAALEIRSVELAEWSRGAWVVRAEKSTPFDETVQVLITDLRHARAQDLADRKNVPSGWTPRWRWRLTQVDGKVLELEEPAAATTTKTPVPTLVVRRAGDLQLIADPAYLSSARERLLPPPTKPSSAKPAPAKT